MRRRLFGALLVVVLGACDGPRGDQAVVEHARAAQKKAADLVQARCLESSAALRAKFEEEVRAGRPAAALGSLGECRGVLPGEDWPGLIASAEVGELRLVVTDARRSVGERIQAFDSLQWKCPECARSLLDLRMRLGRQQEKAQRAERRSQGVSIGMSQADVLASSWGRPEKVNRTTTATRVREQWVYGSGGYLYFDDGVLTAIQN